MNMLAIVKNKKGVALKQVPLPKLKSKDVLIKVVMAGFCRTDAHVASGLIGGKNGLILGHEFSGVVIQIGKKVKNIKINDRVGVMPIKKDTSGNYLGEMLGVDIDGGFAEYVSVPEEMVFKVSDSMTFKQAAYLEPIVASLGILKAPITKNLRGLIIGNNRISKLSQEIIKLRTENNPMIKTLDAVKKNKQNSFDYVLESINEKSSINEAIRVLKPGGFLILKSRKPLNIEVGVSQIVKKELKIFGLYYGDFEDALNLLKSKKLRVDKFFGRTINLKQAVDEINSGQLERSEEAKVFIKV